MMYAMLNEKEIRLHTMIRAILEWINSILQERKFLQAQEEKFGWVLQIITKVSKDLEIEKNIIGQLKSSIKNLDKKIIKE